MASNETGRPPRRIALTGVGRGLGRALARRFLELGHDVAGCTLDPSDVERLRDELPGGSWRQADVASITAVERWTDAVLARLGAPDLLVCCAGIIHPRAPLWRLPAEEAVRVLRVNLEGPLLVARSLLPSMIDQGCGTVVVVSSTMADAVPGGFAPYAASKRGLDALVGSLARDLPDGLSAVALRPGLVRTRILETVLGADELDPYPSPEVWARDAAPSILGLGPRESGRVVPLPGWG